jgi:hypothetical protein
MNKKPKWLNKYKGVDNYLNMSVKLGDGIKIPVITYIAYLEFLNEMSPKEIMKILKRIPIDNTSFEGLDSLTDADWELTLYNIGKD